MIYRDIKVLKWGDTFKVESSNTLHNYDLMAYEK